MNEELEHVGWWCQRGKPEGHFVDMACKHDNIPIFVPVEQAHAMRAALAETDRWEEDAMASPPKGET